ncbi:NADH-quinone oxidoreductase subunit L [Siphonobacter sp. SORGH_AS_1065]|uniref:NADH-quinone oxidoreductase subunit L n=1 Tax=Siphonobacter sp. SORGH_AS_1065 TaxID=3041795 RepID=UPI0027805AB8|nr:NADH-quinone oxidoreductase subunit L [Siphonobacter sp. SORGH_AS_1065]MDQ1086028.1 NADH-quinone oxidoreductase subunit L [Siphonobacter sp. SORGH_AS_1065]
MNLALFIPLLPFLGFLINGLGFRRIPKSLVGLIGTGASLASFVIVASLFLNFSGEAQTIPLYDWFTVGNLNISFAFQIDQLSLIMMLIITGIGSLIHLYSIGYMHHDEGFGKFFAFLNLFLFFMLLLVMGSNYLIMFIGWEGVGLCSYLLIGFWNQNPSYGYAARKAFVMNRIGDLGFLIGIFLIINQFGSLEFSSVFPAAAQLSIGDQGIFWITICLFIGAMGKSAQIPLYTWLPDAMAGPTPVSALIHAATMVTAGIYMIVRSNILYTLAPDTLHLIAWVALATALLAASIGLFQNDIKKVLAYSTVSQLGYMFLGLGVGAYSSGFFHVMTHAFFKALLFLGAGSVIHAMSDEQDIRSMGGLRKKLPITFLTFLLGTIAISGIPPFAGFFSKDEILAHVFEHSPLMWGLAVFGSMMTAFYMFRLLFLTFFGEFRGTHEQEHHLHESPLTMTLPLMVLAVLSVLGGFLNVPAIFGGSAKLDAFLDPIFELSKRVNPEAFAGVHLDHSTELTLMGVSVAGAVLSIIVAFVLYVSRNAVPEPDEEITGLKKLIYHKYYVDEIYNAVFVKPTQALSGFFYRITDQIILNKGGVEGLGNFVKGLSNEFRLLQTGTTSFYLFIMVTGIAAILIYSLRSLIFNA